MFGRYFWQSTAERAVKSFAQSLLALLSAGQIGLLQVAWLTTLSTAGMATLLSVLSSVASSRIGAAGTPSAVPHPASPPAVGGPAVGGPAVGGPAVCPAVAA